MSRMLLTPLDCISLIMGRTLGLVRGVSAILTAANATRRDTNRLTRRRRHGARPCPRARDGRRRDADERAGQGIGIYGAPAGRTRKIGSRLRVAHPARRDVLFLIYEGRRHVTGRPPSTRFRTIQVCPKDVACDLRAG